MIKTRDETKELEYEARILQYVSRNPKCDYLAISKKTAIPRTTIVKYLYRLLQKKLVTVETLEKHVKGRPKNLWSEIKDAKKHEW